MKNVSPHLRADADQAFAAECETVTKLVDRAQELLQKHDSTGAWAILATFLDHDTTSISAELARNQAICILAAACVRFAEQTSAQSPS